MRKFAWIFMAAMTVAGFSACSNTEDEPVLPGMDGGNGGGGGTTTPSVVITDTIYQFNNIEAEYTPINELCPDWTHEIVSPIGDDRSWQSAKFTSEKTGITEKYIKVTSYDSSNKNAGKTYELWMFSPALNVKDATNKVFSFYSEYAFWAETASLEVYVLNEPKSTASSKEKLDVKIANPENSPLVDNANEKYKGWVASGDISLEGKGDVVYIGFRYQGEGGTSATTYCIDDFAFGRAQVEHYLGESGGDTPEPTPEVDWTKAISVADALAAAENEIISVKGYIVGCIKNKPSKTSYASFAEAQAAGDIEWAGAAEFTGTSQVFIADDPKETDGTKCILIRLNDNDVARDLRNQAQLAGNPDRIGMVIYAQGSRWKHYSLPAVTKLSAYKVGE